MFSTSPVSRLSMPTTEKPLSRRYSERCEPMNPAAPVTSALGIRLVCVLLAEAAEQGEDEDLHGQEQRPVLDVVQVVFDPLLQRRVAAPAVHLRPAGNAALDAVPDHVLRDL